MNEKYGFVEVMTRAREILDGAGRKEDVCDGIACAKCAFQLETCELNIVNMLDNPQSFAELVMTYEPPVDWSKVPVDTKILVRPKKDDPWHKKHFAKYENGVVYAWLGGRTSFTTYEMIAWELAKLYKEGEGE